MDCKNNLI